MYEAKLNLHCSHPQNLNFSHSQLLSLTQQPQHEATHNMLHVLTLYRCMTVTEGMNFNPPPLKKTLILRKVSDAWSWSCSENRASICVTGSQTPLEVTFIEPRTHRSLLLSSQTQKSMIGGDRQLDRAALRGGSPGVWEGISPGGFMHSRDR